LKLAAAVIAAMIIATTAMGAVTVRMTDRAAVAGAKVTLGDVASIETANPDERARLAGVVVAVVTEKEGAVRLDSESVRQALANAGVNVAEVNVCGAASVEVSRANAAQSATVVQAVDKYLAALMPHKHFAVSGISFDFTAPADFQPVASDVRPREPVGRVKFDIADARDAQKTIGHVFATVEKTVPVLIARRRISGGTMLSADDVRVEYRAASALQDETLATGDAAGQRLIQTVEAGKVITAKMLQPEDVVRRGDEVILVYRKGGMVVSMKTKALENAAVGDVVRLKRAGERLEHLGKVDGAGRAVPIGGIGE